jgi:NAD(P)-dependent dehydrogenase (short-subunit alcohol dehydrogenase family)
MKKQTILVTGASSGIGLGIAKYFLERGDNVVINSLPDEKLIKAFTDLDGGENIAMVAGDVRNKETGDKMVAVALEKFGSVDVLINNAGLFEPKPFLEVDEPHFDRFLNTNLKGTFFTTQAVVPQMIKQRGGVVINIGSSLVGHGINGIPHTAQISSKAAIDAFTIHLAAEFGKDNIRVNTISPGVIRTPMHGGREDESASMHLLNRVGEVNDVAEMVYTVAKSNFITGAIIRVDGGLGAGHSIQ